MRKPREPHGETSVEKTQYEFASHESELENGSFNCSQAVPTDTLWSRSEQLGSAQVADSRARYMM